MTNQDLRNAISNQCGFGAVADNATTETGDGYPADWPRCPSCGLPALDGHITCGQAKCNEGSWR